jgi:ribose transport system substrate-binding protein
MLGKYKIRLLLLLLLLFVGGVMALLTDSLLAQDYSMRQNEHRLKFGAVYMTLNNPFYEIIDEEIRAAVENHGDILISRDPALSVSRQTEEIQALIDSGIDVLFLNAVDWQKIGPALEIAYKAHVPVIVIDTNVEDDKLVACTIVSDNYLAGVECAEHLVTNAPGGNIVLLKHSEVKSAVDRIQGFMDTIQKYPSFNIIDAAECKGQLELAMPAMEQLLAKHGDIDIVMALNDPAAMGAMAALKNVSRLQNVRVYGVDGAPETKEMIAAGHMTATVLQSPRAIGRIAVARAYEILAGISGDKLIKLPTDLLTRENVFRYNIAGWD